MIFIVVHNGKYYSVPLRPEIIVGKRRAGSTFEINGFLLLFFLIRSIPYETHFLLEHPKFFRVSLLCF